MKKSRIKFPLFLKNTDRVISVSAILISLGTLYVLIYQTSLARQQFNLARLQINSSVMPYLQIGGSNSAEGNYDLKLVNNGLGPAFVEKISVVYQDSAYALDPGMFVYNVINKRDSIDFYFTALAPGRLIPAGEEIVLIGVAESVEDTDKLIKLFEPGSNSASQARIRVDYASAFQEKWYVEGTGAQPVKLEK